MSATRPRVGFYAGMKPPDHPVPSGDRQIARLTIKALEMAGFEVTLASRLRVLDTSGSEAEQAKLEAIAQNEVSRLIDALSAEPPILWYSYHSHYKAPDLIGPHVARALSIPYVLSEPSISVKRRVGNWSGFAKHSEAAIDAADLLLWTTTRDRPGLIEAGYEAKMRHLPAFIEIGSHPKTRKTEGPLRLITVAMMRSGDKQESYRRLAAALACLEQDWTLEVIGDGPERAAVTALFAPFGDQVRFHGVFDDQVQLRDVLNSASIFLWPGVGEGVGLVWLEAQAAGLPVVAEDGPAARALVHSGILTHPDDPKAFAVGIAKVANELPILSSRARKAVAAEHSLEAAARRLRSYLSELIP